MSDVAGMALSVKQLAERLAPLKDDPDRARTVRRIRHWTLTGLLPTSGDLHVGSGQSRSYEPHTAYQVALLEELSRYDLSVGQLKAIMTTIIANRAIQARDGDDAIGAAMRGERKVVAWFALGEADYHSSSSGPLQAVLGGVDQANFETPDEASSAIVLNLTKVFSRVLG